MVIIQLLRLKPPCLMDICLDAKHLISCKYPSDRAFGIIFFNGLNNYKKSLKKSANLLLFHGFKYTCSHGQVDPLGF